MGLPNPSAPGRRKYPRSPRSPRAPAAVCRRRSGGILEDRDATAPRLEYEQPPADGIPADRMRALLGRDRLEMLSPPRVEDGDRSRRANGDIDASEVSVIHEDVRIARQRERDFGLPRTRIDDHELTGIRGAPQRRGAV